ncbi:hypothetical protein QAD02_000428 [Eretmocerus hayati]|uniref:Uncharacterized protein n=1 Tax=Eretmocerus hayati TaxID=131215 RepID=A0ACC2NFQ5_9HYME|nr:hypothetical protein QAD02_000428 [Eretmocerus hayati]
MTSQNEAEFITSQTFEWRVKNYARLPKEVGVPISSPVFTVGLNKFELLFYPGGVDEEHANYIGVYISVKSGSSTWLDFKISLCKNSTRVNVLRGRRLVQEPVCDTPTMWGRNDIGCLGEFTDEVLRCTDGTLEIMCQFQRLPAECACSVRSSCLCGYEEYFDCEELSDVIIEARGKTIHAHRIVLYTGSDVLKAMLTSNMREGSCSRVKINGIKYEVMYQLIRFLYTGEVQNLTSLAERLYVAADMYNIKDLRCISENEMVKSINAHTALRFIVFGEQHNITRLSKGALEYVSRNYKTLVGTPAFAEFLRTVDPEVVNNVLARAILLAIEGVREESSVYYRLGQFYYKDGRRFATGTRYRCKFRTNAEYGRCPGRIREPREREFIVVKEHNGHPTQEREFARLQFKNECLRRARETHETPIRIYHAVTRE